MGERDVRRILTLTSLVADAEYVGSPSIAMSADDLADTSPSVSATYASVSGTASESQVPAPAYTASFGDLTLQTDVAFVVQLASGT